MPDKKKTCFVIMPISDPEGYGEGHFKRVYYHLIKPACEKAGFETIRADDVQQTNFIVIDILQRIINSDIVVCDLSSRNPNVLFELGIRQAFDLPIVLIKDTCTERVFDIQGLRTLDYDEGLRVDSCERDVDKLVSTIESTIKRDQKEVNSLIRLLGVKKAEITGAETVSGDTILLLNAIKDISQRLEILEESRTTRRDDKEILDNIRGRYWKETARLTLDKAKDVYQLPNGDNIAFGGLVYNRSNGKTLGLYRGETNDGVIIEDDSGKYTVPKDDELYMNLSKVPF